MPVNVGGYNTIKVVINGSRHSYYLNGALVCTVNDNTYDAANVMLFGGPAYLATYGLKFDSVSIQAIGSNAPASAAQGVAVTRSSALGATANVGQRQHRV